MKPSDSPVVFREDVEELLLSLVGGDEQHLARPDQVRGGRLYDVCVGFHLEATKGAEARARGGGSDSDSDADSDLDSDSDSD